MEEEGLVRKQALLNHVEIFYTTALEYIQEWGGFYEEFLDLYWIDLEQALPQWRAVQNSVKRVLDRMILAGVTINDTLLYSQYNEARGVTLDSSWSDTWKSSASSTASEKWVYVFQKMKEKQSSTAELAMLLQFVLCIPGEPPNWCTYSSA